MIQFEYDKVNRRTAVIFPNRVKASYRYDPAGNILEIRYEKLQAGPVLASPKALPAGQAGATQSIISRTRYYYDELGNCVSKLEGLSGLMLGLPPAKETTYAYDKLSRLTEVKEPDGATTAYTYDPTGNRLTREVVPGLRPGTTHEKEASTYNELNQLVTQGDTTFEYDPAGNLIAKREGEKVTRYGYNADNFLENAVLPDGKTVSYRYDPFGRRIAKATPDGMIRYAYDAEDTHLEFDPENQPTRTYIHGPGIDDLLGMVQMGSDPGSASEAGVHRGLTPSGFDVSYFLTDRLGSITAVLDQAGRQKETFTYGPFGEATTSVIANATGANQSHIPRFTGRELDPETGLYYYRNRYYSPDSGRFLTPDPIGLLGGANLYAYVHNNPVNWVDPYGNVTVVLVAPAVWELIVIGVAGAFAWALYQTSGGIQIRGPQDILPFPARWNVPGRNTGAPLQRGEIRPGPSNKPPWFIWAARIAIGAWVARFFNELPGSGAGESGTGTSAVPPLEPEVSAQIIERLTSEYMKWQDHGLPLGPLGDPGVPEPATAVLAGVGLAVLAAYRMKRRRGASSE